MLALAIILTAAFAVRTFGIRRDAPDFLHPDERTTILVSLEFDSTWNPRFSYYGNAPLILFWISKNLYFKMLGAPEAGSQAEAILLFTIARTLAALIGTTSVFLCYLIVDYHIVISL